jgi:hypothetical protein
MATTLGPEPVGMSDSLTAPVVSLPEPFDTSSPRLSPSLRDDGPPPNPPFTFPARLDSPSSAPSSLSRSTGQPWATADPEDERAVLPAENGSGSGRRQRPAALPAFSFNPGASVPPESSSPGLLSPPKSPNSTPTGASQMRPAGHGHRRGGSEFVGGRLREGNSISVLGTSPTKSEHGFGAPSFQPPRRGHRRGVSSAISTNDLPILLPPPVNTIGKGSSAPNSPTNFDTSTFITPMPPLDFISLDSPPLPTQPKMQAESVAAVDKDHSAPESPKTVRQSTRTRVGFSDTLEFIPRPLSLVSSDASSTATARPSHSVSGSLSSLVSAPQPAGRESPALSRSPTRDLAESRPSTAGAILEGTFGTKATESLNVSPRRRNSIPALVEAAEADKLAATPSSPSKPKRWSLFFGLESLTSSGSPTKARPSSSSSTESIPRAVSAGSLSDDHGSDSMTDPSEVAPKLPKKKKGRRVKGWAGAILPRMPKGQGKSSKNAPVRPPTPPPSVFPPDEDEDDLEPTARRSEELVPPTLTVTPSPHTEDPPPLRRPMEDSSLSMIDLDAALGPFNTPLPPNAEWDAAQRAAGNAGKRRLHSAQGMKGFAGPGMHYHRRAESAPALPPFDPGRSPIHRFGSSSTMADVFEEDEEEDETSNKSKSASINDSASDDEDSDGETTPPAGPQRRPSLPEALNGRPGAVRRRSSGLSDKDQAGAQSVRTERSMTSLQESVITEEPRPRVPQLPISPLRRDSEPNESNGTRAGKAAMENLAPDARPIIVPASATMPTSPYAISHASSYPSPRSPVSIDAQRISTAPSSVADGNSFHSLLMGEPGPEVRISMDYDIPSLTSSTSTMTRESSFIPTQRYSQPALREQRPMSVSSAAFGRRRSSLVSLGRLISSSHGERSKLSMEVTLDNEQQRKRAKNSKTKRLGRMMQFWKPNKDGSSA